MVNPAKLQLSVTGDREIRMTRDFDAPRQMVFDAMTKPELLKRWFHGPDGWMLEVCEVDLRAGGTYRYLWRGSDGTEMGMSGAFLEVDPPRRIVQTEKFDQFGPEATGTLELAEQGGTTSLTLTMIYDSRETRDAMLKTPMERGVAAGYDRLEKLLAANAAHA